MSKLRLIIVKRKFFKIILFTVLSLSFINPTIPVNLQAQNLSTISSLTSNLNQTSSNNNSVDDYKLYTSFSTTLGGSSFDEGSFVVEDNYNNIYVVGTTSSNDFPIKTAFQASLAGNIDVFLAKFNITGGLLFSTYLGGSETDAPSGIAVDDQQNVYISGSTYSKNFPTLNAFDPTYNGFLDGFITKFNSSGQLIFSSFIGGNSIDETSGIVLDSSGNSYIAGDTQSPNFPFTNTFNNSFTGMKCFISKVNSSGSLIFTNVFGPSCGTNGIAKDSLNNIYVTGYTYSNMFPTTENAYSKTNNGNQDGFIIKFNSTGNVLFSTYFGGSETDSSMGIATDSENNIIITGYTASKNLPITRNAYKYFLTDTIDIFIAKLASNGSLMFCSYFGGSQNDFPYDIVVDKANNYFISGTTLSGDFPMKNPYNTSFILNHDESFILKFNSSNDLIFSTYSGTDIYFYYLNVNDQGDIFMTGFTTTWNRDVFLRKLSFVPYNAYLLYLSNLLNTSISQTSKNASFPLETIIWCLPIIGFVYLKKRHTK